MDADDGGIAGDHGITAAETRYRLAAVEATGPRRITDPAVPALQHLRELSDEQLDAAGPTSGGRRNPSVGHP